MLVPVQKPTSVLRDQRLVRVAALTALAITGRLVFLGLPNVALTFFVVFVAGILEGALVGALVGLLAMTITNLYLSGLHPVMLANGPAMALLGLAGGWLGPWLQRPSNDTIDRRLRVVTLFCVGFFGVLAFSVLSDTMDYLLVHGVTPEGRSIGLSALPAKLLAGLAFNLIPALVNSVPFWAGTMPLLHALAAGGYLGTRSIPARAAES